MNNKSLTMGCSAGGLLQSSESRSPSGIAAARLICVAIVSAIVYRKTNSEYFAAFAVVWASAEIIKIFLLQMGAAISAALNVSTAAVVDGRSPVSQHIKLNYASPIEAAGERTHHVLYGAALCVGMILLGTCLIAAAGYAEKFYAFYGAMVTRYWYISKFANLFLFGALFREFSEISGAVLQRRGMAAVDLALSISAEGLWVIMSIFAIVHRYGDTFVGISGAYMVSGMLLLVVRHLCARLIRRPPFFGPVLPAWRTVEELVTNGLYVIPGRLADVLYAPAIILVTQQTLGTRASSIYWPAIQIDLGLTFAVCIVAPMLLPKNEGALTSTLVRRALPIVVMTTVASFVCWALAPWIFRAWFGDPLPATWAILPLVLVHTTIESAGYFVNLELLERCNGPVIGSALVARLAGVLLSVALVRSFYPNLYGIILGSIIPIAARNMLWMPWFLARRAQSRDGL